LWIARRAEDRPAVTIQGDGSTDKIMLLIEGLTRESARNSVFVDLPSAST
jgi:hypothetical protein